MKRKEPIKITFLGTGTSSGIPLLTCTCDTCSSIDFRDKRLRSSIMINYKNKNILVDTGPDFRQQMLRENIREIDAVLITHSHHDHVAGLDEIRAYNFSMKRDIDFYANEIAESELRKHFDYVFRADKYPGIANVNIKPIGKNALNVEGIEVIPIEVMHNKLPVVAFRIDDFAYVTDIKTISDEEFEKLKGVKHLVLSVLRHEEHFSHFNYKEALDFIDKLKPKHTYFMHLSHQFGKHKDLEKMVSNNISIAYDGMKIVV